MTVKRQFNFLNHRHYKGRPKCWHLYPYYRGIAVETVQSNPVNMATEGTMESVRIERVEI